MPEKPDLVESQNVFCTTRNVVDAVENGAFEVASSVQDTRYSDTSCLFQFRQRHASIPNVSTQLGLGGADLTF